MDEMNNNNFETNDVVSGVENVTHKGGKKAAAITAGVLAVAAGGGGAAYACSDYVKNQVKLAVCKPEAYYAWVNEENAEDFAKKIAEQYSAGIDRIDKGSTGSFSLKYELSDTAKDLLKEEIGGDDSETAAIADKLDSVELGLSAAVKKGDANTSIFLNWNTDRLVTIDAALQDSDSTGFFRIPELTEKWSCLDMASILEQTTSDVDDDEAQKLQEALSKFFKDPSAYLTAEDLEKEIVKYVGVWNNAAGDVTLEKQASVDIADISVEYTVVSVEINNEKAKEIVKDFAEAIKDDEIIKGVLIEKLDAVSEEDYNSALDEVLESVSEDVDSEVDDTVTFSTYIDPKGVIRGFKAESDDDELSYVLGIDGDEVRGEFVVSSDGEEECNAQLTATKADEKYSGNIDINADGETVSVEFTDFEIVNEKLGTFNADTTFIIPNEEKINVKFTAEDSVQHISSDIEVEGVNYGTATVSFGYEEGASIEFPAKDSCFVVDGEFDEDALKEYVTQDEMSSFITTLLKKIGFSEEDAKEYGEAASKSIYNDYSNNDYDSTANKRESKEKIDFDVYDGDDIEITTNSGSKTEKTTSAVDDDDYDLDDDDYDDLFADDKYADDLVAAEDGQAFVLVADKDFNATYMGMGYEELAYKAGLADIKGDGTYTVSVTADTEGCKEAMDGNKPNGFYMLGVQADGIKGIEDADISVKSVKIDGKEQALTSDVISESYEEELYLCIYVDGFEDESCTDLSKIGEWTSIEITFEIKGLK